MLKVNVKIKPYSQTNECGDFYELLELDNYYLLLVGDIGGHGSSRVYSIATNIKELIIEHKTQSLRSLLTLIHSQDYLKNNGMTIFLAQIYKGLPMLSYCAIGNTKSFIYRNRKFLHLNSQSGILGYDIPRTIKTNLLKLLKDDILVISTDGVSIHDSEIEPLIKETRDINLLPEKIIQNFGKKDDDSLSLVIKFTNIKNKAFSTLYNKQEEQAIIKTSSPKIIKREPKHLISRINPVSLNIKQKNNLELLSNEYLIVENLQKKLLAFTVDKLDSIINFEQRDKVKIKTFLIEALEYSQIDIYLNNTNLQIYIHNIESLKGTLEFLFNNYYVFKNNTCIIQKNFIKLNTKEIICKELKEMLALGLEEEDYKKFKESEENLKLLAKQSKLASMGEMMGNIAHQWRQPLSIISTIATGIEVRKQFDSLDDTDIVEEMNAIMKQVNYLSQTIEDFKNFIKDDKQFLPISIKRVIDDTISLAQSSLKSSQITLITDTNEDIQINANKNELEQAFINIINNSKDALKDKEDKYIWITSKKIDDNSLSLSFLDSGGGIKEDIIDKVFDPYFTTKHQSIGTGLGLSMVEKILRERYHSKIEVSNKYFEYKGKEYKGACFTIIFSK
ncbi:ATP-binding protein [Halarcobacter bivalviorum]|uniref:ATP-binding protein n=1 Tax=Halarcobacter bivalviorum TaxID=663364 RepID=UPI00100B4526|nr:ATP-binding protein [Halarcobacter bivalviorum]RXK06475.1 hypothetical protein CRU97_04410 [Halarcobacter bivalviorum]